MGRSKKDSRLRKLYVGGSTDHLSPDMKRHVDEQLRKYENQRSKNRADAMATKRRKAKRKARSKSRMEGLTGAKRKGRG